MAIQPRRLHQGRCHRGPVRDRSRRLRAVAAHLGAAPAIGGISVATYTQGLQRSQAEIAKESIMTSGRQLKGRRIAVLAADGFEKVELSVPVAALRAEGAEVDIISLRPGRIRGVNLHEPASRVTVDRTLSEASVGDYDALLIPGGFINPDLLRQSEAARRFARDFDAS